MLGNLIKATRINRTLPSILLIVLAISIKKQINPEIFLLGIILILIYSAGGIQNALKDRDFELNKKAKYAPTLLLLIATIISIQNTHLFIANLSWITLSLIYNFKSRKILLLDTTIMSITHYTIPFLFALLILGETLTKSLELSIPIYLIFWLITPTKNLKETEKDKSLEYKTIATEFKNAHKITIILTFLSLIPILSLKFFLKLPNFFFLVFPNIILFFLIIHIQFQRIETKKALRTTRIFFSYLIINLILIKWLT